jgi:hypothetical protein
MISDKKIQAIAKKTLAIEAEAIQGLSASVNKDSSGGEWDRQIGHHCF